MLAQGKLVAFPTETVFGLGANALSDKAVASIFKAKGRPADNPLIVHLANREQWASVAAELTESASKLLDAFSPGPITVVLEKQPGVSDLVSAGLDSIGIRIPGCEIAREVLQVAGVPIAAPSANVSGRPSCTTWQAVEEDLRGRIDAILCLESAEVGLESTVVDCRSSDPIVLRSGGVSLEAIKEVVPAARLVGSADVEVEFASPGTRHPHYQPLARVTVVEFSNEDESVMGVLRAPATSEGKVAYCGLKACPDSKAIGLKRIFASVPEYSKGFYEFLREADRQGATQIVCESVPEGGLGAALNDRMRRAAARG